MESQESKIPGRKRFAARLEPYLLKNELENVMTAYVFAKYGHQEQKRDNGIRYFEHPRAVADIIIDELKIRNSWELVVTALLHDIVEDSYILTEKRIEINFGREVALWVKFLTKKPKDGYHERLKTDAPWQVLLVKLCDRLDNLRTLSNCTPEKQRKQILETEAQYIPLADLLIEKIPSEYKERAVYLKEKIQELCASYRAQLGIS